MAVPHGKATRVYVAGYDLSAKLDGGSPQAEVDEHETTGFGVDSKTFIPGLTDSRLSGEGFWDTDLADDNLTDDILSANLAADGVKVCAMLSAATIGDRGYGIQAIENAYGQKSEQGGVTRVNFEARSQVGFDAIQVLHVKATRTTDADGSALDNSASSANGGVGYLQVFAATGGNAATILIEDSPDDAVWSTLVAFVAVTAVGAQRIAVTGTVDRYLRASWTHASPPGSVQFFVAFGRE